MSALPRPPPSPRLTALLLVIALASTIVATSAAFFHVSPPSSLLSSDRDDSFRPWNSRPRQRRPAPHGWGRRSPIATSTVESIGVAPEVTNERQWRQDEQVSEIIRVEELLDLARDEWTVEIIPGGDDAFLFSDVQLDAKLPGAGSALVASDVTTDETISPTEQVNVRYDEDGFQVSDDRHGDDIDALKRHYRGWQSAGGNSDANIGDNGDGRQNSGADASKSMSNGDSRRAHVIAPPGYGKTQLALQTLAALSKDGAVAGAKGSAPVVPCAIYVAPRRHLLDQMLNDLDKFGNLRDVPHSRLVVSSSSNRTEDRTTDPEVIADFLSQTTNELGVAQMPLIVCTYHSLDKVGKALTILNNKGSATAEIGMAIFDEAHHMEGVGKRTGFGLHDDNLPVDHRLFLSGTPKNYTDTPKEMKVLANKLSPDGSSKLLCNQPKDENGKSVRVKARSFRDGSLFGDCVVKMTHEESVEKNITVPLTLCVIDKAEITSLMGKEIDPTASREHWMPIAVQAAFAKLHASKAVSFHSRNARADAFVEAARPVFGDDILVLSANGSMKASEKKRILDEAKRASKSLVANCRLFAEGTDFPEWDLMVMADPVGSSTLAKQMIGRVCRPAPNKERGYLFVPLLQDLSHDEEEGGSVEDSQGFEIFTNAFQAMVAYNPELENDVVFVMDESKRLGRPLRNDEYPSRVREAFVLPQSIPLERRNDLMRRIIVNVGESSNRWEETFALLLAYRDQEGHCKVPMTYKVDGKNLGVWVGTQRKNKKSGSLSSDSVRRLNDIGFVWDVSDDRWERMFSLLEEFKEREGHCYVPHVYEVDGENLGNWMNTQRKNMKKGELDPTWQKRLEDIGFAWDPFKAQWEEMYSLLEQFKERTGHCNVPKGYEVDGANLGTWVNHQRQNKKKTQRQNMKKGKLDASYQKRLEDIGFVWDILEAQWEEMYSLLEQFKERTGHCNVHQGHKVDGEKLGKWVSSQRQNMKKGELNPTYQKRLEDIGFVWDPLKARWEEMYSLLEQFKEREGHCNVPQSHKVGGRKLGGWVHKQRQNMKKGKLDPTCQKRLEASGFVWGPLEAKWENMFSLLEQFKEREGHCNAPMGHEVDGKNLGFWMNTQRQNKKKGKLGASYQKRLEDVGFVWSPLEAQWEEMVSLLEQFKEREGHCNVPKGHEGDDKKLWKWVSTQRQNMKNGKLDAAYQKRLQDIGFVWDILEAQWEDMYSLLEQFKDREGHCNVPDTHEVAGENLGRWVSKQRQNMKKGKLSPDRQAKLSSVGIIWSLK